MLPRKDGEHIARRRIWSAQESQNYINWLELMATFLEVQSFTNSQHSIHIQLHMDNTVAIAYANQMGSTRSMVQKIVQPASGLLGLVCSKPDHTSCGTHPRKHKCHCRSPAQAPHRLERSATGQGNIQHSPTEVRPLLSGPVCLILECSDQSFIQLEIRPGSGCIDSRL